MGGKRTSRHNKEGNGKRDRLERDRETQKKGKILQDIHN
jgi:hypothetical protein